MRLGAGESVRGLVLLCFLLSGASGLIYEVVWTRDLALVFGTTSFAVSTVLTAFMAGLGLGSWLFGRWADRLAKPLLLYGVLELGIGVSALLVPVLLAVATPLYQTLWEAYQPAFWTFSLLRLLLAFAVLLIPTTLMGGTLPALAKFYTRTQTSAGLDLGTLYGVNTLGAVLGAGAAGFWLLPAVGMRQTTWLAVLLNLTVGGFAVAMAVGERAPMKPGGRAKWPRARLPKAGVGLPPPADVLGVLAVFGLSGFAALVYEVAWTRLLTLILGSSTYSFTTMLVTFLVGLAVGSCMAARAVDRLPQLPLALAGCQLGIGVATYLGQQFFGELPAVYLGLFRQLSAAPDLLLASQFLVAALVMLVPTLLMGAVFPLVLKLATESLAMVGRRVGGAYAVNTLGTVAGAFAGGFILLPTLGIQGTVTLAIAINLALGLLLLALARRTKPLLLGAGVAAFVVMNTLTSPTMWNPLVMASGVYQEAPRLLRLYPSASEALSRLTSQFRLLFYREGVGATVTVVERPSLEYPRHLTLAVDGKVDASTAADMSTQALSGHLPLLLTERADDVLVIGLASGVTVGAALQHPVRAVTVVEIEPAVVEASRFFDAFSHRALEDPRVRLLVDDGRNYLLATRDTFDIIISEPSNPWMSGPAKLFTREFFELGKAHLRPGGIFALWLQLYGLEPPHLKALIRTFQAVFPAVLLFQTGEGDVVLLGAAERLTLDYGRLTQRMAEPAVARDLARIGIDEPLDLLSTLRLGSEELAGYAGSGPLNTDDNGLIEFAAPRSLHRDTIGINLQELRQVSLGPIPYLTNVDAAGADTAAVYLGLAKRYLLKREIIEAERLAAAAMVMDRALGHWIKGELHLLRAAEVEAVQSWEAALRENADLREALLSLVLFHQHRARYGEGARYLERLASLQPGDAVVAFYTGLNRYFTGDLTGAAEWLQAALAQGLSAGSDPYFRLGGLGEVPLTHFYLAQIFEKLHAEALAAEHRAHLQAALAAWRWRLEQQPADLSQTAPLNLFRFHLSRGIQIEEEARLAELIHTHVGEPLIPYYKGTTALFLGYPEEAARELTLALHLLNRSIGEWDRERSALRQSLPPAAGEGRDGGAGPRTLAHYYLGLAYRATGQTAQAIAHLEAFLAGVGDEPEQRYRRLDAYRTLATLSQAQGRLDAAQRLRRLEGAPMQEGRELLGPSSVILR